MAELIETKLSAAGLSRYEISNYSRHGWHSRHNVNYWRSGDYLGLGAGAHSYTKTAGGLMGQRWNNEKSPARYMAQVNESQNALVGREDIDVDKATAEFLFLGLRMTEGIAVDDFHQRFGKLPAELYPEIKLWSDAGLMEENSGYLRLTHKGLLVANSIFVHFM
jgi:oxygen-independent coproporphyrinogen-3 oxidase